VDPVRSCNTSNEAKKLNFILKDRFIYEMEYMNWQVSWKETEPEEFWTCFPIPQK